MATINGTSGSDTLNGTGSTDTINGYAEDDTLSTGGGTGNVLNGGDGNDTLISTEGNGGTGTGNYLNGDAGDDVYYITSTSRKGVITDSSGTADTISFGPGITYSSLTFSNSGSSLVIRYNNNTYYNITNQLNSTQIEYLKFDDDSIYALNRGVATIITPTQGNDAIYLTGASDNFDALDGNDTIYGQAGNDVIHGGRGNDVIHGGVGNDTLDGGEGADTVNYSLSLSGVNINLISGNATGEGNDTLSNFENAVGSDYNDVIRTTNAVANVITGNAGYNVYYGSTGGDHYNGGADTDEIRYDDLLNAVNINLTNQLATGVNVLDTLISIENARGTNFDDSITGNDADNLLYGLGGDDTFYASAGSDTYYGWTGTNTVNYGSWGQGITASIDAGTVDKDNNGSSDDTLQNIQNITGTAFDDVINGNGDTANVLVGGDGDDIIDGKAGNDTLHGDAGNDTLYGGDGADTLYGGADNDILYGGAGNDTIYGDGGDDIIYGGAGNNTIDGGEGTDEVRYSALTSGITVNLGTERVNGIGFVDVVKNVENIIGTNLNDVFTGDDEDNSFDGLDGDDTFYASGGDDFFQGWNGNDTLSYAYWGQGVTISIEAKTVDKDGDALTDDTFDNIFNVTGSAYDDVITGNGDNDNYIIGGDGNDTIDGMGGDDTLYGNDGNDTLYGGIGNDYLYGGDGDDILYGHDGNDVLNGGAGANKLFGGGGNDQLNGGDEADLLNGAAGNDVLNGNNGADILIGGAGADRFVFKMGAATDGTIDTIRDFSVGDGDRLDLRDLLSGYTYGSDAIEDFVRITSTGANNSNLAVDVDGGGDSFVYIAFMQGINGLTDEASLEASGILMTH